MRVLTETLLRTISWVSAILLLIPVALLSSCGRDLGTAQGVVEEFLDQYYVHINLEKAKGYTVSVAQSKINEEIRLTAGQTIDASTRKPKINYKLLNEKENAERATFMYEGTIQSDDGSSFTKKWLITARKEGDQWRVSNFTESD